MWRLLLIVCICVCTHMLMYGEARRFPASFSTALHLCSETRSHPCIRWYTGWEMELERLFATTLHIGAATLGGSQVSPLQFVFSSAFLPSLGKTLPSPLEKGWLLVKHFYPSCLSVPPHPIPVITLSCPRRGLPSCIGEKRASRQAEAPFPRNLNKNCFP